MRYHRMSLAALAAALLLTACVSTPEQKLSLTDVRNLQLTAVSVSVAPGAIQYWPEVDGEDDPIEDASIAPAQAPKPKPTVAAAERERRLTDKFRTVFTQKMSPVFDGSRPVRAVVKVSEFVIIPKNKRAREGGRHQLKADIVLVDAKTGQEVSAFRDQTIGLTAGTGTGGAIAATLGGGIGGLIGAAMVNSSAEARGISADILIGEYVDTYSKWLLPPSA